MKIFLIVIILFFALFCEISFVSLPLVLLALLLLGIIFKEFWIFPVGFGMGIVLDMLSFRTVGVSSIFFVVMLGIIFLYDRKFEVQSLPFTVIFSFLAALGFGLIFKSEQSIFLALITSFLAGGIFYVLLRVIDKKRMYMLD